MPVPLPNGIRQRYPGPCTCADCARFVVIIDNVIGAEVVAVVVFKSFVRVTDCDVSVGRVACHLTHLEKKFEIHHIVDYDRTFPSPQRLPSVVHHIPGLKYAGFRTEAGGERAGGVDKNCVVTRQCLSLRPLP